MLNMDEIREEVRKLECGATTFANCEKLAMLYTILDHEKGMEMAEAYERKERTAKEWDSADYKKDTMPTTYSAKTAAKMLDMATAEEWMKDLHNEDGTQGPHWTMEQVKQVMAQKNISGDPVEMWAAMNMLYSDFGKMAKKFNVNTVDFYLNMAEYWLKDEDAVPNKLAAYYNNVVMH